MAGQKGFWDIEERLAELSAEGDPLDKLFARLNGAITKAGYLPMRCHIEHVFAEIKSRIVLVVRTIGIARAEATIMLPTWLTI